MDGCDFESHVLLPHLEEEHGLTVPEYLDEHPEAPTLSEAALEAFEEKQNEVARTPAPAPENLTVDLMGFEVPVDVGVGPEVCLPLPNQLTFPTTGAAKGIWIRVIRALIQRRSVFYWGMPGTGKDAIVHAYSALTRTPVVMVTFRPGTDLAPWFYVRRVGKDGSGWSYGHLWRTLTEGIECRDGKRRAPLLVLSDVDRADEAQAEWFRILADSIEGRILDPEGKMVPLFRDEFGHGVQFFSTANSCGTGDARGRMTSANPIDGSLFDRLGRKIEADYLDWEDEGEILKRKFPVVATRAPLIFQQLGNAVMKVRAAIKEETIYAELTHRGLCEIMAEAEDILHFSPDLVPPNLLKEAKGAWTDGLDSDTKLATTLLMDPHIAGGAF